MLEFVVSIAHEAGELLRSGFRQKRQLDFKSRAELVTDMDLASERLIVERLTARFPDHRIVTEEGGGREQDSSFTWLVDPLDGTNNYAHGNPFFCVSIALLRDRQVELGVVYDPIHEECFTAERGAPAYVNGTPLRVSEVDQLMHAQISTGFPYDRWSRHDSNVEEAMAMVMRCQDLRRMGSAALDLCYVAAGRSEGHWELELKPWDSAAGALILEAAGGRVTDVAGQPFDPWRRQIVATNGRIHADVLAVLSETGRHTL